MNTFYREHSSYSSLPSCRKSVVCFVLLCLCVCCTLHKSITVVHLTLCCDICDSIGQRVGVSNLSRERTRVCLCVPSLHYRAILKPQNTQKKSHFETPKQHRNWGHRRCHMSSQARGPDFFVAHEPAQARAASHARTRANAHTQPHTPLSFSLSLFLSTAF